MIDADGNVTLNINNKKPGLYYGVQVLAELGADPKVTVRETAKGLVVPAAKIPEGNAAFFRVVVDFKPFLWGLLIAQSYINSDRLPMHFANAPCNGLRIA